jgi:hypothetical protein
VDCHTTESSAGLIFWVRAILVSGAVGCQRADALVRYSGGALVPPFSFWRTCLPAPSLRPHPLDALARGVFIAAAGVAVYTFLSLRAWRIFGEKGVFL